MLPVLLATILGYTVAGYYSVSIYDVLKYCSGLPHLPALDEVYVVAWEIWECSLFQVSWVRCWGYNANGSYSCNKQNILRGYYKNPSTDKLLPFSGDSELKYVFLPVSIWYQNDIIYDIRLQ